MAAVRKRVVIVGGGFGGLACARKLHRQPLDVVLLDGRNYHLFTPLLYQVATALLNPSDIAYPLRRRFRRSPNVRFRQDVVTSLDLPGRTIRTGMGEAISFDYLVLATGSTNNYFGNEELARSTIGLKTLPEALRLRNHVLSCLERASLAKDPAERRRWLTFVIVGGGPTGVEYAGALHELLRLVLGRDYPDLSPALPRIVLAEGRDRLLDAFPERLGRYAERTLARRGVEVRTGALGEDTTDHGHDRAQRRGRTDRASRADGVHRLDGMARGASVLRGGLSKSDPGVLVVGVELPQEGPPDPDHHSGRRGPPR